MKEVSGEFIFLAISTIALPLQLAGVWYEAPSGASGPAVGSCVSASEDGEIRETNLFCMEDPAQACELPEFVLAWKRDDTFASTLTVWCHERPYDGGVIVAYVQVEGRTSPRREVIEHGFASVVYSDPPDGNDLAVVCREDVLVGWSDGGTPWCVGDDLYYVEGGERYAVGENVRTNWWR